jgi:hypothetical protein
MTDFVSPAAVGGPPKRTRCIQTRINIDADEHPKIREWSSDMAGRGIATSEMATRFNEVWRNRTLELLTQAA